MNPASFLKMPDVEKRTGLTRFTIYRMIKRNEFPRQVQISPMRVVWIAEEIDEWFQKRLDARKTA